MKFLSILSLVAISSVPAFALQPVQLEMEPVDSNSLITAVTLYRGRAAVTRTAELELTSGGWSVFFRNLPVTAMLDSVQASVHGDAKLLAVDTTEFPIDKDNNALLAELATEIELVDAEIIVAKADDKSLELQLAYLQTLLQRSASEKELAVDLTDFSEQLAFVGSQTKSLQSKKLTNAKQQVELAIKRSTLVKRKNNISGETTVQRDVIIDIGVITKGTVTIAVTYLVSNASWAPTYSIRATEGGESIKIDYDAELWQRTGEDWKDVQLLLSTAQPQRSASPPMPSPWYVDIKQPQPPERKRSAGRGTTSFAYAANAAQVEGEIVLGTTLGLAISAASVVGDGPAVSFALPRTLSVPSKKDDVQKTAIASIGATADLYRIAVPMLTDSVFIRSDVTNDSPYILLPGEASIFHGSDFVGRTSLPSVAPGETFSLDLGIDPSITATRTLLEKKTSSTGLFGSSKETLFDYRVTIANGHDEPLDIRIWDRIPVSRNEDIAVDLKSPSSALSTDVNYLEADFPRGLLRWDLTVPANSTGESSFVLTWRVDIARGKNVEMTPLPE